MVFFIPNGDSISQLRSRILAVGVALLFTQTINFVFQFASAYNQKPQIQKEKIKTKILQTSRLLYLYYAAVIFSIYPPFYQGVHSAVMAWIIWLVLFLMHLFCFFDTAMKQRSIWSLLNLIYHIFLVIWFFLIMGFTYAWYNQI